MTGTALPFGHSLLLGFWTPGFWEILLILGLGLVLFGRRLPEVGRSLGKSIVEFKRGLHDVKDEIDRESTKEANDRPRISPRAEATARTSTEADEARAERS